MTLFSGLEKRLHCVAMFHWLLSICARMLALLQKVMCQKISQRRHLSNGTLVDICALPIHSMTLFWPLRTKSHMLFQHISSSHRVSNGDDRQDQKKKKKTSCSQHTAALANPQCSAVLFPYSDSLLLEKHKSERKKKPEWRSYVHASGTVGIVGMHENKLVLLQKSVNFLLNIYMLSVGNAWSLYYSKFTVCEMDLWSAQLGLDVYLQQQRECTNISAPMKGI